MLAVDALGRTAFVGPPEDGWVSVYDEACDEQDEADTLELGKALTGALEVAGLAVLVHDGDTFSYWLFDRGDLVDRYDSWPGYFEGAEPEPAGGDAEALCRVLGIPRAVRAAQRVLHGGGSTSGDDVHAALLSALGLPDSSVSMSYRYLALGERPGGEDDGGGPDDPFVLVGGAWGHQRASRRGLRAISRDAAAAGAAAAVAAAAGGAAAPAAGDGRDRLLEQVFGQIIDAPGLAPMWPSLIGILETQVRKAESLDEAGRQRDSWHGLRRQLPMLRALLPSIAQADLRARLDALIARIETGRPGD